MKLLFLASLCLVFFQCDHRSINPEMLLGRWEGRTTIVGMDGVVRWSPVEAFLEFRPKTVKIEYVGANARPLERNYKILLRGRNLDLEISEDQVYLVSIDENGYTHLDLNEADRRRPDVRVLSILTFRKIHQVEDSTR